MYNRMGSIPFVFNSLGATTLFLIPLKIVCTPQTLAAVSDEELKKPLKVHFVGEEGIDEGGVQKEYFQVKIIRMSR